MAKPCPSWVTASKLRRKIAFANPLLRNFDEILFIKRHGSLYSHMVDQFYGMTAQPGGRRRSRH